ncbi:IS5/IS1182 family transposase, partial [Klebsiella pneumoniae]
LRDYDGQVAEAMALVRALNKMTKAGRPENTTRYGGDLPEI